MGDQLQRARERAGLSKSELGRRVGWADNTNVARVESGGNTETKYVEAWARECECEILVVPSGSADSLAGRVHEANERERRLAAALLDLLIEFRDSPSQEALLDYLEHDIVTLRERENRRRALAQ